MSSDDKIPIHGFQINQGSPKENNYSPNKEQKSHSTQSPNRTTSNKAPHFSAASSTPKSKLKVMEAGQEHTGRWTREEHEAFLQALQQYGKEWKKVAAKVKTRTVVQTRTHAQKYFQKLQKGLVGEKGDFDVDSIAEAKKMLPIASTRKGRSGIKSIGITQEAKKQQQTQSISASTPSAPDQNLVTATQAVAELMTQLREQISNKDDQSRSSIHVNSANQLSNDVDVPHYDIGDSADVFSTRGYPEAPVSETAASMKIIAPHPDQIMKRNMFPEPSPAACGKRKAAEIAVAQMLAGVATTHDKMHIARHLTPPPEKELRQLGDTVEQKYSGLGNAGNLQIINPDTLLGGEQRKSGRGHEPVTPWDTQLEALDK